MRKNIIFVNHGGGHTKLKQVQNIEGAVLVKFSKQEWKSVQGNKQVKNIAIYCKYICCIKLAPLFYMTELFIFHPVPCTCIEPRSLKHCS